MKVLVGIKQLTSKQILNKQTYINKRTLYIMVFFVSSYFLAGNSYYPGSSAI